MRRETEQEGGFTKECRNKQRKKKNYHANYWEENVGKLKGVYAVFMDLEGHNDLAGMG